MKNRYIGYLAFLLFVLCSLYFFSKLHLSYESRHASLNDENMKPDLYLENARHYVHENTYDRSTFHLEKAKKSLRRLEEDIDIESGKEVEIAIADLNKIEKELNENSLVSEDMNKAFARTLETVALAELRISEKYAESAKLDIAMVALKYAKLHLKNAIAYENLPAREYDLRVYSEIDSLIQSQDVSPIEIAIKLDKMIKEMNEVLALHS